MAPLPCLWNTNTPDSPKRGGNAAGHTAGLPATLAPRARGTTTGGSSLPGTDRPPCPSPPPPRARLASSVSRRGISMEPRDILATALPVPPLAGPGPPRALPLTAAPDPDVLGSGEERGGAGRARPRGGVRAVPAHPDTPSPGNPYINTSVTLKGCAERVCAHLLVNRGDLPGCSPGFGAPLPQAAPGLTAPQNRQKVSK